MSSFFLLTWGVQILCLFNQHQTPRSDSANLEPSEPIFYPQILEPRWRTGHCVLPECYRGRARATGSMLNATSMRTKNGTGAFLWGVGAEGITSASPFDSELDHTPAPDCTLITFPGSLWPRRGVRTPNAWCRKPYCPRDSPAVHVGGGMRAKVDDDAAQPAWLPHEGRGRSRGAGVSAPPPPPVARPPSPTTTKATFHVDPRFDAPPLATSTATPSVHMPNSYAFSRTAANGSTNVLHDKVYARLKELNADSIRYMQARPALLGSWDNFQGPFQTRMRHAAC